MKVFASLVINTPAGQIWAILRNFIGLTMWNKAVTGAHITNGKAIDQVGAVRHLDIADGTVFLETLIALSDQEMYLKYDIVKGPIPVTDYMATMRLRPITVGNITYAEWSAEFNTPNAQAKMMQEVVGNQICRGGLLSMKAFFER